MGDVLYRTKSYQRGFLGFARYILRITPYVTDDHVLVTDTHMSRNYVSI